VRGVRVVDVLLRGRDELVGVGVWTGEIEVLWKGVLGISTLLVGSDDDR
jgi:hypothetical protein